MYVIAREQIETARVNTDLMRILLNSRLQLIMKKGSDRRRTNLFIFNEIALFISNEYENRSFRDIVIAEREINDEERRFHRINHTNVAYFSLYYVLFFSHENFDWTWFLRFRSNDHARIQTRYSQRVWLRYYLFKRFDQYSIVLRDARLFQQYIVDCYTVIDQSILDFHRNNQNIIRADLYNDVQDALTFDNIDREIINRFSDNDRHIQQLYQNSIIIARHFDKSITFVIFIANSQWSEIQNALKSN